MFFGFIEFGLWERVYVILLVVVQEGVVGGVEGEGVGDIYIGDEDG